MLSEMDGVTVAVGWLVGVGEDDMLVDGFDSSPVSARGIP